jgi:hypothetical protein
MGGSNWMMNSDAIFCILMNCWFIVSIMVIYWLYNIYIILVLG